jgi:hypothetical protein
LAESTVKSLQVFFYHFFKRLKNRPDITNSLRTPGDDHTNIGGKITSIFPGDYKFLEEEQRKLKDREHLWQTD